MTKFWEARRGPSHPGKSGYIRTRPSGSPYTFPFQFIEETATQFYPEYRQFIPKNVRRYSDSYYDLRDKPYKYWYDKYGKPHINKWWQNQLDTNYAFQTELQKLRTKKSSYAKSKHPAQSKYHGPKFRDKYRNCSCSCHPSSKRRWSYGLRKTQRRPSKRRRQWF